MIGKSFSVELRKCKFFGTQNIILLQKYVWMSHSELKNYLCGTKLLLTDKEIYVGQSDLQLIVPLKKN